MDFGVFIVFLLAVRQSLAFYLVFVVVLSCGAFMVVILVLMSASWCAKAPSGCPRKYCFVHIAWF